MDGTLVSWILSILTTAIGGNVDIVGSFVCAAVMMVVAGLIRKSTKA